MEWIREIEVVIFDLDGTLYQDHHFYHRYLEYMLAGTHREAELEQVINEADRILNHEHSIKLGHFYHQHHDLAIYVSQGKIMSAHTWGGEEIDHEKLPQMGYEESQFWEDCLYAGDAWGVVSILARRLNISSQKLRNAFDRIREDMISSEYAIKREHQLMQAISNLANVNRKILMTNNDHRNGVDCVNYLGIEKLFDQLVYDTKKPDGIANRVQLLLKETGLQAHQVLSIGDNAWNDLHPIKKLGGRTVLISPYETLDYEPWDIRLHTIEELSQFLIELQQKKEVMVGN